MQFLCQNLSIIQDRYKRMSSTAKTQKRYTSKTQKPSKVLLVCVYDTVVFEISNETIRKKFQKFGKITKLLIFEKGEVSKFFIEFDSMEEAAKAKTALDGTKLCDSICKMTIYFSNFSNVDIKHQPIEVIQEPSAFAETFKSVEQDYDHTKGSIKQKQRFLQECEDDDLLFHAFGGFTRSKTDNPKTLSDQIAKLNTNKNHKAINEEDELDHSIKQSIDNIIGPQQKLKTAYKPKEDHLSPSPTLRIKQDNDVRSSILYFAYRYILHSNTLYNLFSNFGNLSCIVIKKQYIYLKFRTKEFAAIALTYLNNTVLEGNLLGLREYPESSEGWAPIEGEYCQCVYFDFTSDRFTPQRSITINPPSQTLHISSMKRQICREATLREIFSQYGQIDRVHILQQSNQKNMALVRFRNMQDSFSAISHLHNQYFNGRKMQISFTKSKV